MLIYDVRKDWSLLGGGGGGLFGNDLPQWGIWMRNATCTKYHSQDTCTQRWNLGWCTEGASPLHSDPFSPSLGCLSHPGLSISLLSAATQCFPSKFFCRSELLVHMVLQGQDWHTSRSYLKWIGLNMCTRLDLWVGVRKAMVFKLDSLLLRTSNDARFSAADATVVPLAQAAPPGCTSSKSVAKINSSTS